MTPTYRLIVYGCQMNDYDGETIAGVLEGAGYRPAPPEEDGDVTLVYTCAVRKSATDRAWGRITALAEIKKKNPRAVIGVGGCWAAVEGPAIRAGAPHVDFTFGTGDFHNLIAALAARGLGADVPADGGAAQPRRLSFPRANVSIMTGCDNYCAYCIVPYARGPERSRPADEVYREVEGLVARGFRDVTLIGQNVNSYRWRTLPFAGLLAQVDRLADGVFLRFVTNHPKDFDPRLVEVMSRARNVARHLHLPLQSGSDRILAAMNRGYDRAHYDRVISLAREAIPGICVTTDLLVGFPGETEDDFLLTLDAVERLRFDAAYTFIYSPRPGTAAATLPDDVPRPEKIRRLQALIAAQRRISQEINQGKVGTTVTAVVEGTSARRAGEVAGRTSENKIINFAGDYNPGEIVEVVVTAASSWTLRGEVRKPRRGRSPRVTSTSAG